VVKGIGNVFWRGVELYREARADRASIEQYGKGCPDDWIERHVYTPHATMGPTVLRVAPALDVRPNINVPDMDTMKALLAHRFQAMTDFKHGVLKPALREEAAARGTRMRRLLPRKLRQGLADDGRWLKPEARAQMHAWVEESPRIRALVEARARLAQVLTARSNDAAERLHQLQAWCHEAEASGIRALQDYAARLKGYSLQATRA
jgi:stearoyl-CoA desaturase (delta-9 desaturase)